MNIPRRSYAGFGFGAIQAGLFLYEAQQSGAFDHLAVAEVVPDIVQAVRCNRSRFMLNIAHADGIEQVEVGPIEILNPGEAADRKRLVEVLSLAGEIATAVPSVECYADSGPGSLHALLAEGLRRKMAEGRPPALVYAAENHNHAAEILESHVLGEFSQRERPAVHQRVQFLNTVIGKMSGVVTDEEEIRQGRLATMTPDCRRALLVEEFNDILISRVRPFEIDAAAGTTFTRGLSILREKDNLLPLEEAKLYGHNAVHALAAYMGGLLGVERISQLADNPEAMDFLRTAFCREAGAALISKHRGVDELFTEASFQHYADDLLRRMINPHLRDTVSRVGRNVQRKLGWDDRLIGTLRLALSQGVKAPRFAIGAAAALVRLDERHLEKHADCRPSLERIWATALPPENEKEQIISQVSQGLELLRQWKIANPCCRRAFTPPPQ